MKSSLELSQAVLVISKIAPLDSRISRQSDTTLLQSMIEEIQLDAWKQGMTDAARLVMETPAGASIPYCIARIETHRDAREHV